MSSHAIPAKLILPVRSVDGLLDREGSPVIEPHIHPSVAQWIYREAKEFPAHSDYELEIRVPAAELDRQSDVVTAIHDFFQNEAGQASRELGHKITKGLGSLVRSLAVVAGLVLLAEFLRGLGGGHVYNLFSESLVIIGWVTLWIPVEMLLFERYKIRSRRNLARQLANAKIRLVAE